MQPYMYQDFMNRERGVQLLACKKIHPKMGDEDLMYVYYLQDHDEHSYIFRYQDTMITNLVRLVTPIDRCDIPLFCYEWFEEWIELTEIYEMFEGGSEWYNNPTHMNSWKFEEKWRRRYGYSFGRADGERARDANLNTAKKLIQRLFDYASKEEQDYVRTQMEEVLRSVHTDGTKFPV